MQKLIYFFLDASADRIGIGTATPCCELHVQGAGCFTGQIVVADFVSCANSFIYDVDCNANPELHIGKNTTEDMFIQSVLYAELRLAIKLLAT